MSNETNKLALNEAVGLIPVLRFPEFVNEGEWELNKLGEIGEPLMCKRILKEQTTTYTKNGIPFYKIGTFGREADAYISVDLYEGFKNKYSFPKVGDILISASGTIGRLVVYDGLPAYFQDSNIVWLGNDESQVLNSYLYHCYSTIKWQTSDGGIIRRLYNSDLKNIKISYSKNPQEQQKIASCLSSLDDLLDAHSQKLGALKDHKKGLMQNLFPQEGKALPKYRFKEFENDGEWNVTELSELGYLVNGLTYSPDDVKEKGLLVLRSSNIQNGLIDFNDCVFVRTDIKGANLSETNDILVCVRNGSKNLIGKNAIIPKGIPLATHGAFMTVFRAKNPEFVFQLFQTNFYDKQVKADLGATINSINGKNFLKYEFPIPENPQEQQKIASCLSSLDALISAQAEKIAQMQLQKKGLMQGLFPKIID